MLEVASKRLVNKEEAGTTFAWSGTCYFIALTFSAVLYSIGGWNLLMTSFPELASRSDGWVLVPLSAIQVAFYILGSIILSIGIKSRKLSRFLTEEQLIEFKNLVDKLARFSQKYDVRLFVQSIESQNRIPVYDELVSLRRYADQQERNKKWSSDLYGCDSRFSSGQKSLWEDIMLSCENLPEKT